MPPARWLRHCPLWWGGEIYLLTWVPLRFPSAHRRSDGPFQLRDRMGRKGPLYPRPHARTLPTCLAQSRVPAEQQRQQQRAPRSAPGPHAPAARLGRLSPGALSLAPASPPPSPPPPPPPRRPPRRPAAPARALRGGSGSHAAQRAARRSERSGCPALALQPGSGAPLSALLRLWGSERSPGSRALASKLRDRR